MADGAKEGRKRVGVVDRLIKRLRASGELHIQPVRHFGPKYGARHNPYANGVKKYELTGAGIYREDIASENASQLPPKKTDQKSHGGRPRRAASTAATAAAAAAAATATARNGGGPVSRRAVAAAAAAATSARCPDIAILNTSDLHNSNSNNNNNNNHVKDSNSDNTVRDRNCKQSSSNKSKHGQEDVDLVEGDEAGQSDVYLCRLDNGFAQETTL